MRSRKKDQESGERIRSRKKEQEKESNEKE